MACCRSALPWFGNHRYGIADFANHAFSPSCCSLFLQKFSKDVQLAAEQQVVRGVYKKLQGRQRASNKNKNYCAHVLWATISISTVFLLNRLLPPQPVLPMELIMLAVAVGVSIHILRLPTFKKLKLNGQKLKKF